MHNLLFLVEENKVDWEEHSDGVHAPRRNDPKAAAFDAKMQKEFGDKYRWPVVASLGYDGMKLLLKAIDGAGSDPTKIRDALEGISDF